MVLKSNDCYQTNQTND